MVTCTTMQWEFITGRCTNGSDEEDEIEGGASFETETKVNSRQAARPQRRSRETYSLE